MKGTRNNEDYGNYCTFDGNIFLYKRYCLDFKGAERMNEKEKILELIRKLPESRKTEFYYMVLGALFAVHKSEVK